MLDLHFIRRRQHLDDLIAVAQRSRKIGFQTLTQHPIHGFGMQRESSGAQLGGEVLLIFEVQAAVGRVVQIPSAGRQFVEDVGLECGEVTTGALEAIDELIFTQAMYRARRSRKRGDEDQAGRIRRIGVAIGHVDLFHLCRASVGDVVSDGFAERGVDGADFGRDFIQIQIEIVGVNQVHASGLL